MLNYAFGHQAGCGKDTASAVLVSEFGYERVYFAEPVYRITEAIQDILGLPKTKNRELLQFIGEGLRGVLGQDIWIRHAMKRIDELKESGKRVCVSDLRYRDEADALREADFTLVKVTRANRSVSMRDPTHRSEVDLLGYNFDLVLTNDGSVEEFRDRVRMMAKVCLL